VNKVLSIVGPTAVGKTALSIELAKTFPAEIISGDSMQIYKGMDIGTGKITKEEMQGIPHYMIDIKEPDEPFSVAEFKEIVECYIRHIHQKNKLPILVGGTGLYIRAVLYDYEFNNRKRDETVTKRLEAFIAEHGVGPLYEKLKKIDPKQAEKIHPNNHRRVIRALEIYETTGLTMTEIHKRQKQKPKYDHLIIGLMMERNRLYAKINKRVDEMIANGLVDEVRRLYELGYEHTQAMQAIGYKELIPYFKGEMTLEEAIQLLKQNTRRYAKRQLTWFKNQMDVEWFDVDEKNVFDKIRIRVESFLND